MPELVEPSEPYLLGDLNIDYAQSRVTVAGRPVVLTGLELEYRILAKVLEVPNRRLPEGPLCNRVDGLHLNQGHR